MILCVCPNPSTDKLVFLDTVEVGGINRAIKELSFPRVKGVHDALGIKELDEEMVLTSPWGGFTGERIKKECEEREIKCLGAEVEYWNRTFLIIKSKDEFNQPETLGLDPQIGPKEYDLFLKQYKRLLKKPSLFA